MKIKFEVIHTHTLAALAAAGMGVGILPKIALPSYRKSAMQALPISSPALVRSVSIITQRGQSFSPATRKLTNSIQKSLRTLI
jgi:DNA-binding transcriptional LysR family regulator